MGEEVVEKTEEETEILSFSSDPSTETLCVFVSDDAGLPIPSHPQSG